MALARRCSSPPTFPGQSTTKSSVRRDTKISGRVITHHTYCFSHKQCEGCPLRAKCLEKETRFRTISVHEHEQLVSEARSFQRTDAFQEIYRLRVEVEHRIARLTHFGLRQARHVGSATVLFQLAMTAALANLTLVAFAG